MIAVNETKKLLNKDVPLRKPVEWTDELNKMKTQPRLDETSQELLSALNEFRNLHAKIIDEPVSEILTFLDMLTLVKERPNTETKITDLIKRTHKAVPESIQTWKKLLTRILKEGAHFWNTLKLKRECHVCQGKHDYLHMAWGCIDHYSQDAVNRFMMQSKNQVFREKEYNRRLKNWQSKYGDIPCPYLKKPTN